MSIRTIVRILYVTQTFPPEPGATQRPLRQAVYLQELGCDVTILTTMPYYPLGKIFEGYRGKWLIKEKINGIEVVRVWSIPASNKGRVLRIISQISFAVFAAITGLFLNSYDVVIASVPNIGTEIACILISRLKKCLVLLELRDVIPDNMVFIGISKDSFFARLLYAYFIWIYQVVDLIAVPGEKMVSVLERRGVNPDRILLLPHAADSESLIPTSDCKVKQQFQLCNKVVALYAGSFSTYYDIPNLVAAAGLLQKSFSQIHMLLVGTGPEWERVKHMIATENISNVSLVGAVAPNAVPVYLNVADILLYSLVGSPPSYFQDYLTTKMCEYLMAGKPVIAVEDGHGCGDFLKKIGAGLGVPAHQPAALAKAITFFLTNKEDTAYYGDNARLYAENNLDRKKIVTQFYHELLQKMDLPQ